MLFFSGDLFSLVIGILGFFKKSYVGFNWIPWEEQKTALVLGALHRRCSEMIGGGNW